MRDRLDDRAGEPVSDPRVERPADPKEAAEVMRTLGEAGVPLRFRGGGTKSEWGAVGGPCDALVSTERLDRIVEHNAADLTAVLQSGVRLAEAQSVFAEAGQMLALDPPPGKDDAATVGGMVATADYGPLRHRYGAPRDLLLGIQVALSDGTLARSGGKVIKNVAGYDLAKLLTGSFGTLGFVVEVAVRLHPLPAETVTLACDTDDAEAMQQAALELSHGSFEMESFDASWESGGGRLLARFGGVVPHKQAQRAGEVVGEQGVATHTVDDDSELWAAQRAAQRAGSGAVVKISAVQTDLVRVARAADNLGARLVGRAAHGAWWMHLPSTDEQELTSGIEELRDELSGLSCVVRDAPRAVREKVSPWGDAGGVELKLMRRIKSRFDAAGVCNPGVFLGGL